MKMVVHLHTVHQTPFERREKKNNNLLNHITVTAFGLFKTILRCLYVPGLQGVIVGFVFLGAVYF